MERHNNPNRRQIQRVNKSQGRVENKNLYVIIRCFCHLVGVIKHLVWGRLSKTGSRIPTPLPIALVFKSMNRLFSVQQLVYAQT